MRYGFTDFMSLLGSLGLFLYGMKVMSDALMEVAGDKMRTVLANMTSNRIYGVLTGFLITTVIQSSSATTLMVVSFTNAAFLTLTEAVTVIMGANIGTTVTAWLISILGFRVSMSAIALPLVFFGFLMMFSNRKKWQHWGQFVVGFAILFIGLQFLKDAVPDIGENPEILERLKSYTDMGYWSVLLFLLIGTLLTVVIQSSSATMALTLVMCFQGWISFDLAAAMVLGENIGTTITANLAALVANYQAKRAARAHLIFNAFGVVWMLVVFYPYLDLLDEWLTANGLDSPFAQASAVPVALSLFHTTFNILNTTILLLFVPLIVKIVTRLIPCQKPEEPAVDMPQYINKAALRYPQTAIRSIIDESRRLFEGPTFKVVAHALNLHREDIKSDEKLKKVVLKSKEDIALDVDEEYYTKVKTIYSKIIKYCTLVQGKFKLEDDKIEEINNLKLANRNMVEAIKSCKGLKKNITAYMKSDNPHMVEQYDHLRRKVSKVLRAVYLVGQSEQPRRHLEALESRKEKVRQSDVLVDGTLDTLIRGKQITSEMATSLANDSENVARIAKNLINAAELLYIRSDTLLVDLPKLKKKDLRIIGKEGLKL